MERTEFRKLLKKAINVNPKIRCPGEYAIRALSDEDIQKLLAIGCRKQADVTTELGEVDEFDKKYYLKAYYMEYPYVDEECGEPCAYQFAIFQRLDGSWSLCDD